MDILRALSSPNVDICRKTLEVAMDLVNPRNIEEVVQVIHPRVIVRYVAVMYGLPASMPLDGCHGWVMRFVIRSIIRFDTGEVG